MSLLRTALLLVGVLVLAILGIAAYSYATDYGVEATITDKGQDNSGYFVIATTKIGGVQQKQDVPADEWALVQKGNFVVYHIASKKTELYSRDGGRLLYSS